MIKVAAIGEAEAMAQASAWLARLQRPDVSEADGVAFDEWLSERPEHAAAYAEAVALWHEFETAAADVLVELESQARRPARARVARPWMFGGAGGLVAAALAVAVLPPMLAQPTVATYATGKGQHQTVKLADGSTVDLNAETRLTVRMARGERKVTLAEGEAIFDVIHDTARPFTVETAGHVVRDVGTQFDVRSRQGDLMVAVAKGEVEVGPTARTATEQSLRLTPGQRLDVRAGVEKLQVVNPQEALSWRSGRLVYRNQPLGEVVADLNRQFVDQIEIGDPALADTPITGVIVLDDPNAVVARLSLMLPIRSVPSQRGLLLLRK